MGKLTRIGMDTSKSVFRLHGIDDDQQPTLKRKLRRGFVIAVLLSFGCTASANASFQTFDPSNSMNTFATSINKQGTIVGWYMAATDARVHGFIRDSSGKIKTYDVANTLSGTQLQYIDSDGNIWALISTIITTRELRRLSWFCTDEGWNRDFI